MSRRRIVRTQKLDVTGTSASVASVFDIETYVIRLEANTAVHFRVFDPAGASSTCTSNDPLLYVGVIDHVEVTPGQKLSAIQATAVYGFSSTAASIAGTIWVSELG